MGRVRSLQLFIDRDPIFLGYCNGEDERMIKNEQVQTDGNSRWLDETEEKGFESKAIIV